MRITIRYNPDALDNGYIDDETDVAASISAYNESLVRFLSNAWRDKTVQFEVVDEMRIGEDVDIEPPVDNYKEHESIVMAVEDLLADHYAYGDFWVEKEAKA